MGKDIDKHHENRSSHRTEENRVSDRGVMAQNDLMSNAEDVADQVRRITRPLPQKTHFKTPLCQSRGKVCVCVQFGWSLCCCEPVLCLDELEETELSATERNFKITSFSGLDWMPYYPNSAKRFIFDININIIFVLCDYTHIRRENMTTCNLRMRLYVTLVDHLCVIIIIDGR